MIPTSVPPTGQVVYEVNLSVDPSVVKAFGEWLNKHVAEMLEIPGFVSAQVVAIEELPQTDQTPQKWSCQYILESREHLEIYFKEHAARMRADGLQRFENKFTATRRIYAPVAKFHLPTPTVVLRYFPCRARRQAIRYVLADHGIQYSSEEVEFGQWQQIKSTAAGGPLKMLPVLEWNGTQVTQAEGIASFLGHKLHLLGDTDKEIASSVILQSCAHQDLTTPLLAMFWAPIRTPSASLSELVSTFLTRTKTVLTCIDDILGANNGWSSKPLIGHYFAFYALELLVEVFGEEKVFHGSVNLLRFVNEMKERPGIKAVHALPSTPISLSPKEAEVRAAVTASW
eukprot:c20716_g1_i1.p1 GENE.c20716_g1_i1~~c20716_g1_i1.p1  ORF type:complete len:356 (-),score=84.79 c20716_g1_i1:59-1084(-)